MTANVIIPSGRWSLPALVVSVILTGGAATTLVHQRGDELPSDVAFRIDSRNITVEKLDRRIDTLSALYSLKKPADGSELQTFRRDAAKSMAVSMILADEAKDEGIVVSEDEARAGLDNVIKQSLGGDESAFSKFLGDSGISETDVLAEVSRTLATSKLYTKVTAGVKAPSEQEARKDYDAHRVDMVTPERRTLSNIVVSSKAEAQRILGELRRGASFAALARARSLDSSTNTKGGTLGTHAAPDMDEGYAKVAFAAGNHTYFGPVSTGANAWNVGRVDAVLHSEPLSFTEVKSTLIAALQSREQLRVWNDWLGRIIKASGVVYADSYRPAHPDAVPSTDPEASQP